jgi:hypothetical protein
MKKWQRATKNELESFLTHSGKMHSEVPDVYDTDGNIIPRDKLTRAQNLTGAGIEYASSYIEYLLTHHKKAVKTESSRLYYEAPIIEWEPFIDIVTGGIYGQRQRAERAIMNLHASPKPRIIQAADGHLISMQPFVISFDWGKPDELNAKAAARFAGLKRGEEDGLLPIKTVSVMFAKPLFEDFFRKNAGTYSFPVGMYAKMFQRAHAQKLYLANLAKKVAEKDQATKERLEQIAETADQEAHISAYARFARYIAIHHNMTPAQQKKKDSYCFIYPKTIDLFKAVYPSAITRNGRGVLGLDRNKAMNFLCNASTFYLEIPDFILYPVMESRPYEHIRIGICTSREAAKCKAQEAAEEVAKNEMYGHPAGTIAKIHW